MERLRAAYGASPLHLLAVVAFLAIAGYGFFRITQSSAPLGTLAFLAFAVVAHDLLAFPLYSALNLLAHRSLRGPGGDAAERRRVPALNHVRVPFALGATAFLLFLPLILGLDSARYEFATGEGTGVYLGRWLALCAALFAGSALVYAVRLRLAGRRDGGEESGAGAASAAGPGTDGGGA